MSYYLYSNNRGFSPTSTSNLQFWGDAIRTSAGGVASWTDFSGNGYNAVQATGANQPVCTASIINGKNALFFDGINDNLALPAGLLTALSSSNVTMFTVAQTTASGTPQQRFVGITDGSNARLHTELTGTAATAGYNCSGAAANAISIGGVTTTNFNIYTGFRSGTTLSIQINNGTAQTNTNGANIAWTVGNIGSAADNTVYFKGYIPEILIFNRALTAAEIIQINQYLSRKWGITIS